MNFIEKDRDNLVEFLNFVSDKAKFELGTKEVIKFYGLLAWAQKDLMPKINANILEVKAVHHDVDKEQAKAKPKKAK